MSRPELSIIIPVFNDQDSIAPTVFSVQQQSFKDVEVIVVDDGSTDATLQVIQKIASQDSRIRVYHQANAGASSARNTGLEVATGRLVLFLDADDQYANASALADIVEQMTAFQADLLLFGFKINGTDGNRANDTHVLQQLGHQTLTKEQVLAEILDPNEGIKGYVWRACYQTELLQKHHVRFTPTMKIFEDQKYLFEACLGAAKIAMIADEYYVYHLTDNSMSTHYVPSMANDAIAIEQWLSAHVVRRFPELTSVYLYGEADMYLRVVQNEFKHDGVGYLKKCQFIYRFKRRFGIRRVLRSLRLRSPMLSRNSAIGLLLFRLELEPLYGLIYRFR